MSKAAPIRRELTVAEVIAELSEMPQHYPVTVVVDGMVGVITGIWRQSLDTAHSEQHVLIGERPWSPPIMPDEWARAAS